PPDAPELSPVLPEERGHAPVAEQRAGPVFPPEPATSRVRPPPLNVDYLQFGVALHFLFSLDSGPVCPADAEVPCILGSGGGLAGRAGYRSRGPWYVGGAYSLAKLDTSGLMRLGVLQQLTGEMRYLLNLGQRAEPFVTSGVGGVVFGNEWGVEAWGLTTFGGAGFEVQLSRTTVVGMTATYQPFLFFEWTDRAGQQRDTGIAHFWGLAITMEARDALGSHSARGR
ncbi:MAG: hypothetical protein U1E22_04370, partial [Coriobacteriia bacterium]|nr:hypothetical protein [Coriobacteriia bacterium]